MLTIVAKLQAAEGKADELKAILTDMVAKVKAKSHTARVLSEFLADRLRIAA